MKKQVEKNPMVTFEVWTAVQEQELDWEKFVPATESVGESNEIVINEDYDRMDAMYQAMYEDGPFIVIHPDIEVAEAECQALLSMLEEELFFYYQNKKSSDKGFSMEVALDAGFCKEAIEYFELLERGEEEMARKRLRKGVARVQEESQMNQNQEEIKEEISMVNETKVIYNYKGIEVGMLVQSPIGEVIIDSFEEVNGNVVAYVFTMDGAPHEVSADDLVFIGGSDESAESAKAEEDAAQEVIKKLAEDHEIRKFLDKEASKLVGNKLPKQNKEEEVEMRKGVIAGKENKQNKTINKEEYKMKQVQGRVSKGVVKETSAPTRKLGGRVNAGATTPASIGTPTRRIAANAGGLVSGGAYTPAQMPWYLNAGLYPSIKDLKHILMTGQYAPLGITGIAHADANLVFKNPNHGQLLVVQVQFGNGVKLNFQVAESHRPGAELESRNIIWNSQFKRREYVFSTPNTYRVGVECSCGAVTYVEFPNESAVCHKCGKEHAIQMASPTANLKAVNWRNQVVPGYGIQIHQDVFAIAMAYAQYVLGYSMYGVITEQDELEIAQAAQGMIEG